MNTPITTMLKTILAAAFLMSAGVTFAQNNDNGPGQRGQRGMHGMPAVENMMRALHRLDLTDDQQANIRAVMQGMKTEIGPLMEEMRAGHKQLRELIKADKYDDDGVAALAAREGDRVAERVVITSRALSEVYGYLTDEQRAELEEMATQRMERRSEKRKW